MLTGCRPAAAERKGSLFSPLTCVGGSFGTHLNEDGQTYGGALTRAKKDLARDQPGRIDVLRGRTLLGDPTQKVRR